MTSSCKGIPHGNRKYFPVGEVNPGTEYFAHFYKVPQTSSFKWVLSQLSLLTIRWTTAKSVKHNHSPWTLSQRRWQPCLNNDKRWVKQKSLIWNWIIYFKSLKKFSLQVWASFKNKHTREISRSKNEKNKWTHQKKKKKEKIQSGKNTIQGTEIAFLW